MNEINIVEEHGTFTHKPDGNGHFCRMKVVTQEDGLAYSDVIENLELVDIRKKHEEIDQKNLNGLEDSLARFAGAKPLLELAGVKENLETFYYQLRQKYNAVTNLAKRSIAITNVAQGELPEQADDFIRCLAKRASQMLVEVQQINELLEREYPN